uniref:ZT_dimer domain-containing protein n=1 Tax=Rhabditophanes sp. KR3021 TaxID=114890 RepID=A0AC35UEI2_9BILA
MTIDANRDNYDVRHRKLKNNEVKAIPKHVHKQFDQILKDPNVKPHLVEYYSYQKDLMDSFHEDLEQVKDITHKRKRKEIDAEDLRRKKMDETLATISLAINISRLILNLVASIISGSYSIISTLIDSCMDLTTGSIIYLSVQAINNTNNFAYPRGRQMLEILTVIVCAVFMGVSNILMIFSSFNAIVTSSVDISISTPVILIVLAGIISKFLLLLACLKNGTSSSRILVQDLRNDIATNFVALAGGYIGYHYYLFADPIGAILICSYIVFSWCSTACEQIPLIVGGQLNQQQYSRIMHLSINHDPRIICLDHLMVYHIGEKAQVELHIVMKESLILKDTHDIVEGLENKLKDLDFVERVFVHCDYRLDGDE